MSLFHLVNPKALSMPLCNNGSVRVSVLLPSVEFFARSQSERCRTCTRMYETAEAKKAGAAKTPPELPPCGNAP